MDLERAGAVVFGGASGLGEATANRLSAAGAEVVIADLDSERGAAVAEEIGLVTMCCGGGIGTATLIQRV